MVSHLVIDLRGSNLPPEGHVLVDVACMISQLLDYIEDAFKSVRLETSAVYMEDLPTGLHKQQLHGCPGSGFP